MTQPESNADHRDVDLVDLQLQNAATWNLLDNAIQTRELVVRLHGAALGLAPFAVALADTDVVLVAAALGAAFLLTVSLVSFINLDALRLLQFRIGVEEGRARVRLRGGTTTFATETHLMPPMLRAQQDPMGITTRSALGLAAVDVIAVSVLLGVVATLSAETSIRVAAAMIAGAVGAGAAAGVVRWLVHRSNERGEQLGAALSAELA